MGSDCECRTTRLKLEREPETQSPCTLRSKPFGIRDLGLCTVLRVREYFGIEVGSYIFQSARLAKMECTVASGTPEPVQRPEILFQEGQVEQDYSTRGARAQLQVTKFRDLHNCPSFGKQTMLALGPNHFC